MPLPFELSDRAERDIQDIVAYTFENFGRAQVDIYVDGLFHTFSILSENPQIGEALALDQSIRRSMSTGCIMFSISSGTT